MLLLMDKHTDRVILDREFEELQRREEGYKNYKAYLRNNEKQKPLYDLDEWAGL